MLCIYDSICFFLLLELDFLFLESRWFVMDLIELRVELIIFCVVLGFV